MLTSPRGNVEVTYSWGLGIKSNNEAEALALLKGFQMVTERKLQEVDIFGDSTTIIRGFLSNQRMKNAKLESITQRIKMELEKIKKVKLYLPFQLCLLP